MFARKVFVRLVATVFWLALTHGPAAAQQVETRATNSALPLSSTPPGEYKLEFQPMTIAQERAKFEADQRTLRMEWNRWISFSPLRPNVNASYMSNGSRAYYIPSRGYIVSSGRSWFW